ncbi:MAG: lipopolysaccharide assembly protein LapA domain-containing protein [Acidimicrobiales bacterium]
MTSTAGGPPAGAPGPVRRKKRSNREVARLVVTGLGLVLLIAFVLDNSQTVKVGFVFYNAQLSLIWVLLIAAVLGALVDRLVIYLSERRKRAAKPK